MIKQFKNNWLLFNLNRPCILCGIRPSTEAHLCQDCLDDLPWIGSACQRCAEPMHTDAALICPQCQKRSPSFNQVITSFEYRFPINQLVQLAKFNGQTHYLNPLAELLGRRVQTAPKPDLIVPVPLHPKRLHERQYNQAALVAKHLARQLGVPYSNRLLVKTKNTRHQADLNRKMRRKNLKSSFQCRGTPPASIAVVDDVMTTGTTAAEISRILKQSGCQQVYIWVIARTAKELHLR
ncbi:ComF family protein [Amphritea opalescens]|uniref:ComF family protein n=1 Tax=Amphritea opalescens TaxID=2490544 RepID=A0A430KNM1_9GAMM|nr:ComF family protein [Amphritea opalescens]RTE65089.1 ComF family protein [Amphritea opalescens]